jgi:hypothetical protein
VGGYRPARTAGCVDQHLFSRHRSMSHRGAERRNHGLSVARASELLARTIKRIRTFAKSPKRGGTHGAGLERAWGEIWVPVATNHALESRIPTVTTSTLRALHASYIDQRHRLAAPLARFARTRLGRVCVAALSLARVERKGRARLVFDQRRSSEHGIIRHPSREHQGPISGLLQLGYVGH